MTTEVKEKQRRGLSASEQETIINFNKEEGIAYIFTYEKTWQRHLEQRLGLEPVMDNGFGGREYAVDKSRVKPPRPTKRLSSRAKAEVAARLKKARAKQVSML